MKSTNNPKLPNFKMGISFSGNYREKYIEPICNALLELGYTKDDIFYDRWHEYLINGIHVDDILREIYYKHCEFVIVVLSPDYAERNWPGRIEWRSMKELINEGADSKIGLLKVGRVDFAKIQGLYVNQDNAKMIDTMPPMEVAGFIKQMYEYKFGRQDISYTTGRSIGHKQDYSKPFFIQRSLGGIIERPEWRNYFTNLIQKIAYYLEMFGDIKQDSRSGALIIYYRRAEILIMSSFKVVNDENTDNEVFMVKDGYINERNPGTCVCTIAYQNENLVIWDYIPGDWDDRIFTWK